MPPSDIADWLIWSKMHAAWWRPDCKGYTETLADAGFFPEVHVRRMFSSTWPNGDSKDAPIHVSAARDRLERERAALKGRLATLAKIEVAMRQPAGRLTPETHPSFLNLSPRSRNLLKAEGCATIQEAANLSEAELRRTPGVGGGTIRELAAALSTIGLGLKP